MSKESTGENNVELTNNLEERKENHIPDSNKEEDHKGRQKDHGIRSRMNSSGKLGASPSSLAALVKGKAYLIDPKTPFLPKPEAIIFFNFVPRIETLCFLCRVCKLDSFWWGRRLQLFAVTIGSLKQAPDIFLEGYKITAYQEHRQR